MATEAVEPDHTTTDEQYEKKVKEEANIHEGVSKHDKAEHVVAETEKPEDSPEVETSAEDKVEDAQVQGQATPSSNAEGEAAADAKKDKPAVEKIDGSPSSENLKEEKELIPGSQTATESAENEEEKQPMTAEIPEVSVETVEESCNTDEANASTKSEAEVVKPEPAVTEVQEKVEEEAEDKLQEADQPNKVAVADRSLQTIEKPRDPIQKPEPAVTVTELQEKPQDQEKESQEAKQSNTVENPDTFPDAIENSEPADTQIQGKPEEEAKESQEKAQEELPSPAAVADLSAETIEKRSDAAKNPEPVITEVQQKSKESEQVEQPNIVALSDSIPSAETNEKQGDAVKNPEPIVTKVQEKSGETEEISHEKLQDAEQPITVATLDTLAEKIEKLGDGIEEKTREPEFDAEASKEATKLEARPTATEKAQPVVTDINENPGEPEKQRSEREEEQQQKTIINQTESESSEKPVEAGNSNIEAVPANEEKPELVESNQTSDDIVKEPIKLKEEKPDKVEETSIAGNSAQAVSENPVESSPAISEKVIPEPSTDDVREVSNEVDGISKDPEKTSINQEAKTELEKEDNSAPTNVERKVAVSEDKKKPEKCTRKTEGETKKVDEQNETKIAATEKAGEMKAGEVADNRAKVENEKQGQLETKAYEGATAVTVVEQARETLASKLEEKEEEPADTGTDNNEKVQTEEEPVKTEVQTAEPPNKEIPKETATKPAQKQSNNILSKVKQSLVKAKKAIIGKSPPSKPEAKGDDIKVK